MEKIDKRKKEAVEAPLTLNYAVAGVAFNFTLKPACYIVDYQAGANSVQKRLPGGRFQHNDVIKAVESFLMKIGVRNNSLEFFCSKADDIGRRFQSSIAGVENYAELNPLFDKMANDILLELQKCKISEDEFRQIIEDSQYNTVRSEFKDEIDASRTGDLRLISVSTSGVHSKLGFVCTDIEAPVIFTGSADKKVVSSRLVTIDEQVARNFFNGHSGIFQKAINELEHLGFTKEYDSLKKYVKASM